MNSRSPIACNNANSVEITDGSIDPSSLWPIAFRFCTINGIISIGLINSAPTLNLFVQMPPRGNRAHINRWVRELALIFFYLSLGCGNSRLVMVLGMSLSTLNSIWRFRTRLKKSYSESNLCQDSSKILLYNFALHREENQNQEIVAL